MQTNKSEARPPLFGLRTPGGSIPLSSFQSQGTFPIAQGLMELFKLASPNPFALSILPFFPTEILVKVLILAFPWVLTTWCFPKWLCMALCLPFLGLMSPINSVLSRVSPACPLVTASHHKRAENTLSPET